MGHPWRESVGFPKIPTRYLNGNPLKKLGETCFRFFARQYHEAHKKYWKKIKLMDIVVAYFLKKMPPGKLVGAQKKTCKTPHAIFIIFPYYI